LTGPSSILVVEPMSSGYALLKAARQLGIETVAASFDDGDRHIPAALRELIDTVMVIETNDERALTEAVQRLHGRRPLSAIMPGFEFYVDSVARIAHSLGLPGLPPESVDWLRDKTAMRRRAAAAGLRVPRYQAVDGASQLAAAAAAVGFPLVLKPARSAGSVHVSRADDMLELHRAYEQMRTDPRTDLGRGLDGTALVEEYVAGPEVSVEGYVSDGEVIVAAVTGKVLGPEPYFVEVGHIVQAELDPGTREAVLSYVEQVCRALRLTLGPFHCELRIPDNEPVLIEIGARLAGDHIVDLVELVTGISLPKVMLAAYAGLDLGAVAPPAAPRVKVAGIGFLTAPQLTVLPELGDLTGVRDAPDVIDVEFYLEPGDPIPPPEDFRSRLGHVIYTADSAAAALRRWQSLQAEVRVG
jgi:biotin carboxylase